MGGSNNYTTQTNVNVVDELISKCKIITAKMIEEASNALETYIGTPRDTKMVELFEELFDSNWSRS